MDERWLPRFDAVGDAAPHARLLSNGRLTVFLTSAGTGYTTWGETRLTAWAGDRTEDADGQPAAVITAGPARLPLVKDGAVHAVRITLGSR
jgi:hypothetical protein